jgi:hypothetical protein
MPTFGDMVDYCQNALGDTSPTTESLVKLAIVRAIDQYKSQRFSWNRVIWDLDTVAADSQYATIGKKGSGLTFTTNQVFAIDSAFFVSDGRKYQLDIVDYEREGYANLETQTTGRPAFFAVGASEFLVTPTPDGVYTIEGVAVVDVNQDDGDYDEITASSADADTSIWFDRADRMIQLFALSELFLLYRREPQWASAYLNQANQEFARHVQDYERREASHGRREGYWNTGSAGYFI